MQILPGSGNVMGGQAVPVKHKGSYVEEMRIKNGAWPALTSTSIECLTRPLSLSLSSSWIEDGLWRKSQACVWWPKYVIHAKWWRGGLHDLFLASDPPMLPGSRMGNAWVMRSRLQAATELYQKQLEYCESPTAAPFVFASLSPNCCALTKSITDSLVT